jgi:hypothetical protein
MAYLLLLNDECRLFVDYYFVQTPTQPIRRALQDYPLVQHIPFPLMALVIKPVHLPFLLRMPV